MSLIKITHVFLGKREGCIYVNPNFVTFVNTANLTVGLADGTKVDTDVNGCDEIIKVKEDKKPYWQKWNDSLTIDCSVSDEAGNVWVEDDLADVLDEQDRCVGRLGRWD